MNRNMTLLAFLLLLLSACTAEMTEPQQSTENRATRSNFIPMEVAKKKMLRILSTLNGQIKDDVNKIGTGNATGIVSAIALDKEKQPVTRGAEETDADCYVFRMENNMFAIMSATTDKPELLAIGNGNPNFEDSTALLPNVNYWSVKPDIPKDTILPGTDPSRFLRYERLTPTMITHGNGGLCKVKWGNLSPYNDKMPFLDSVGKKASAGCNAVAVAQMMTVENLHGGYYNDHIFDWNLLSQRRFVRDFVDVESSEQVATLINDINNKENLDVILGYPVSEAFPSDIGRVLKNFHFSNGGILRSVISDSYTSTNQYYIRRSDFVEEVRNEIDNGYPVIFSAWEKQGGHTWLCHGMLEVQTPVLVYSESIYEGEPSVLVDQYIETAWYFQMNWGWDSQSDGYYLIKWDSTLDNHGAPDIAELGEISTQGGYNCYDTNTIIIRSGIRF